MMKLYAVLLGGRAIGCNVELHDVVFTVGNSLEDTYPQLINKWFGVKKGLHIDASIHLQFVDGYKIMISDQKQNSADLNLYFVNFGGYEKGKFSELHEVGFYVAASLNDAKLKAKNDLCKGLFQPHCDDKLLIDDILSIQSVDKFFINLHPTEKPSVMQVESHYIKLHR